ncbi:Rhamnosyltransferase WbbL [Thalassocella blandensis]|nr:Rhamnosyltransferase WbbL [Thalassocella blandensis]
MLYCSIVSHGHFEIIKNLGCLENLAQCSFVTLILVDNIGCEKLNQYCGSIGVNYIQNEVPYGFGKNNNIAFEYAENELGMNLDSDCFLVLNPDVFVSGKVLSELIDFFHLDQCDVATINLYKDDALELHDANVRKFPTFLNFFLSVFFGRNSSVIDKSVISMNCEVDWASGSFLMFRSQHYSKLGGFDERYFMYCEDIDICYRSKYLFNSPVLYIPSLNATHIAMHRNKKLFSKHFYWHVKNAFLFLLRKNVSGFKTSLKNFSN